MITLISFFYHIKQEIGARKGRGIGRRATGMTFCGLFLPVYFLILELKLISN